MFCHCYKLYLCRAVVLLKLRQANTWQANTWSQTARELVCRQIDNKGGTMQIQNIIATSDFGCQLNLTDIHLKIPETKYNPNKFSGLTLQIHTPRATAQLFRTGKIVCLGTKCETDLHLAGYEFAKILSYLGYNAIFNGFIIKNMVASCDVGFKIRIEQLTRNVGGIYVPELFPALDYKLNNVTVLIFHSGKVIITGAKTKEEIEKNYDKIYPALFEAKNVV